MRQRIYQPVLVRSTDPTRNSKIVKKSRQLIKKNKQNRAEGTFIKNAYGVKGRSIYIGI